MRVFAIAASFPSNISQKPLSRYIYARPTGTPDQMPGIRLALVAL
jgi:hypothetical protein